MAYSVSTSISSQSDLMNQVSTFAQANGWTEDEYDATTNMRMSLHRNDGATQCYVHFWWNDTSSSSYGTSIGMYQSLGWVSGNAPYAHTNDSQNGANSAGNLDQERGIKYIGDGPYTSLHMFAHTDPYVIYCVLEFSPGIYRHFGFGQMEKVGTWVGGNWCGGHHWEMSNSGADSDSPSSSVHNLLLDGVNYGYVTYTEGTRINGTLHIEGMPNQTTENPYWGVVGLAKNMTDAYTDGRDGNQRARICGGCRQGISVQQFGWLNADVTKGYIPIIPVELWYVPEYGVSSTEYYYLGKLANMGHIQLNGIDAQQVITIGADQWMAFPAVRKAKTGSNTQESWNMGLIYMK